MEVEHLFKGLLEQPNGLARRIVSKAGSDPSRLLDKTEAFIRQQPRVTGDSGQVGLPPAPQDSHHPQHATQPFTVSLCTLKASALPCRVPQHRAWIRRQQKPAAQRLWQLQGGNRRV